MSQELRCYGCGNPLQATDETQAGYVPSKILATKDNILCQRCFKLQHYNTNSEVELIRASCLPTFFNIETNSSLINSTSLLVL